MEVVLLLTAVALLVGWRQLRRWPLVQCPRCKGKPVQWKRVAIFFNRGRVCTRCHGTGLKSGSKR